MKLWQIEGIRACTDGSALSSYVSFEFRNITILHLHVSPILNVKSFPVHQTHCGSKALSILWLKTAWIVILIIFLVVLN